MESLNKIFTENDVNSLADAVLKKSVEKVSDELATNFTSEMADCIYQHYQEVRARIESELIKEITEEFVSNPMQYKFSKLREKLFLENKDLLIKTLTDEAIFKSVEDVIENYTHRNYQFQWRWKEAIVKIVFENWSKFEDDQIVNNQLLREIKRLKSQIATLNQKLADSLINTEEHF
jgi:hypothetical protein